MPSRENPDTTTFLHIHDPEINVSEIMERIESRLKSRDISPTDIERISGMRFSPYNYRTVREFDPSHTANLFEKGISTPQFTNPKLWFLRGPLRYLLTKIVDFYSLLDKKLSENRVRAFFQVLNELVIMKKKQDVLSSKLEEFYKEYAQEKYRQTPGNRSVHMYTPLSLLADFESSVPPESESLLDLVRDAQPVLIYYPSSLGFLEYCNAKNLKYKIITPFEEDLDKIQRTITDSVYPEGKIPPHQSILFHANAHLFSSSFWEGLLNTWRSLEGDTRFVIRFREGAKSNLSPFRDNLPMKIDIRDLSAYLRSLGFQNIHIYEKDFEGWTKVSFMNISS